MTSKVPRKLSFQRFVEVTDRHVTHKRSCWLTTQQIEACRQTITRKMKRRGKVWIRVFPQKSYTKKPLEVRMGKGKANVEGWVAVVRPANMLFEVGGVSESLARDAMRLAAAKLPIPTRFVTRL